MPPSPAHEPITLNAITAHARSLEDFHGETDLVEMHAEVCARRQIEIKDQELRSFVIKHSVIRIHCMVVFAVIVLAVDLLGQPRFRADGEVLAGFIAVVGLVVAASTRSIGRAVRPQRM